MRNNSEAFSYNISVPKQNAPAFDTGTADEGGICAMKRAALSFVSCFEKREENIRKAVHAVGLLPETTVLLKSSFCETEPCPAEHLENGCMSQCAIIMTALSQELLRGACMGIAAASASVPAFLKEKASLRVDLLLYESEAGSDEAENLPNRALLKLPWIRQPLQELLLGRESAGSKSFIPDRFEWPEKKPF